jgi:hypothetical protein
MLRLREAVLSEPRVDQCNLYQRILQSVARPCIPGEQTLESTCS